MSTPGTGISILKSFTERSWTGAGETRHPVWIPDVAFEYFKLEDHEEYDLMIPFTRDSWHGRMRACRGVGASLSGPELESWDREHRKLLDDIAPEQFEVLHYAALAVLTPDRCHGSRKK